MGEYIVHRARFFDYEPKAIRSLAYDEALKKLAVARSDNTIEIWCMANECQEAVIPLRPDNHVEVVFWCRSQLFSGGQNGFIVLYDLARLTPKKLMPSVGGAIWCATRNKSETKIAIGTESGYVVLYELQSDGISLEKLFNKQDSRICSIAWHRDEELIVTGGIDNIRIWNAKSGQVVQRIAMAKADKNTETYVYGLAITSNFTIISGDSRGKVSIWNAEQATLIRSFQTHSQGINCLCIDESENHIYCSGRDPAIVQLDYVTLSENDNFKSWAKSNVFYNHSHDVNAILVANNYLISGGADTRLIIKNVKDKQSQSAIRKYNPIPQKRVIDTCDDFVLLQYEKHLELWRLGATSSGTNLDEMKNGDYLPLLRSPRKFLELKSKNDLHVVCSTLGADPTNKGYGSYADSYNLWLSYSDLNVIHIYRVEISSRELAEPKISVEKIKSLPLACGNRPATLMKLYATSNKQTNSTDLRLCYMTNKSCLQCLKLVNFVTGFSLECSIECVQQEVNISDNKVYLMACKDDYVATVDTDLNISVWDLKSQQQVATLPRYERMTTCLAFHPETSCLLVCYSDRKIVEYDFEANEYTKWSRETSHKYPRQWHKLYNKLINCFYDSANPERIVVHDEQYLTVVNKTEKMPADANVKIFQQQLMLQFSTAAKNSQALEASQSALHISSKYRYLLYANELRKGELLVVEVTPLDLAKKLPPSLKQKKFGT